MFRILPVFGMNIDFYLTFTLAFSFPVLEYVVSIKYSKHVQTCLINLWALVVPGLSLRICSKTTELKSLFGSVLSREFILWKEHVFKRDSENDNRREI